MAAVAALALLLAPAPTTAQGLLEFLFGPEPPTAAETRAPARRAPPERRARAVGELSYAKPRERGPGTGFATEPNAGGYCVRACDGYFFPLIKTTLATRQQSCELACPSAPMEIYDGATIETARNRRGQRYTALPRAFAFRDGASAACVCNDPQIAEARAEQAGESDPTLRSGDVLVETGGAFVYSGSKLVPLAHASFISPQLRDRLRALLRRPARDGRAGGVALRHAP